MTVTQLIRKLEALRAKHGNVKVCFDSEAIADGTRHDTWQIVDAKDVEFLSVNQCDGDGFTIENKDGTERFVKCAVLS